MQQKEFYNTIGQPSVAEFKDRGSRFIAYTFSIQTTDDFKNHLNPNSLEILPKVYAEPSLAHAKLTDHFQFMRIGYFCLDSDSTSGKLVFNRTVTLRDMWAKEAKK